MGSSAGSPEETEGAKNLILAGRIIGCHGIRGYLKIGMAGGSHDRAEKFRQVFIGNSADNAVTYTIEDVRIDDRRVLLKLTSIDDRTTAETLRGKMLFVPESEAIAPPKGSYFIHDLIGCEVRTESGEVVGTLGDVMDAPAQHLWVVNAGDRVHHIPAVKEFIVSVDVRKKEIVVNLPEGLLGE